MSGKIFKINKSNNFCPKPKYVHAYYEKEPSEPRPPPRPLAPSYTDLLKTPPIIDSLTSDYDQVYSLFKTVEKGLKAELENVILGLFIRISGFVDLGEERPD